MARPILALLLTLCLVGQAVGGFVAPDLRQTLFLRDRVPLDPDQMRALATQLTRLAAKEGDDSPTHLRARAQLLAIAGHLDPANPAARSLTRSLAEGREVQHPAAHRVQEAESSVWQTVRWLRQKGAGTEGRHLAALLVDALRILNPQHPELGRHDPAAEAARWDRIVAPLEEFTRGVPPDEPAPSPGEGDSESGAGTTENPEPEPWSPPIPVRQNSLQAPLFVFGPRYKLRNQVVPLRLTINESAQAGPLTYALTPVFNNPVLDLAREETTEALLAIWPRLPEGHFAIIDTGGKRYAQRNGAAIAGPAALLLHASLSGKTLRDDLVLLAGVQSDGSLQSPAQPWYAVTALRNGPGGRLLIPPSLKDEFAALIVLGDPGFFLKYEVLVVSSLETALAVGTREEDPSGLASVSATFARIREAGQGRDCGPLVALPSVRERLNTIHHAAPYHLSAEMLLLQGSGTERPKFLNREILTRELRRALDPMQSLLDSPDASLTPDKATATWTECRAQIDGLQRFVDNDDRELFKEVYDLINDLRTLSRELKKDRKEEDELPPAARRLLREIRNGHRQFIVEAARTTGEPVPPTKVELTD